MAKKKLFIPLLCLFICSCNPTLPEDVLGAAVASADGSLTFGWTLPEDRSVVSIIIATEPALPGFPVTVPANRTREEYRADGVENFTSCAFTIQSKTRGGQLSPGIGYTTEAGCGTAASHTAEGFELTFIYITPGPYYVGDPTGGHAFDHDDLSEKLEEFPYRDNINTIISHGYQIADREIPYEIWHAVRNWAVSHGYTFANDGKEGGTGTDGADPVQDGGKPVTNINWRDAIVWCNALSQNTENTPLYTYDGEVVKDSTDKEACDAAVLNTDTAGYRLPWEAEWEIAARGGNIFQDYCTIWAGGCSLDPIAWYSGNSNGAVQPGAQKAANELSLYDMTGNVQEFCGDWYGSSYPSAETDPQGAAADSGALDRIVRGGNVETTDYFSGKYYGAVYTRKYVRPDLTADATGFRIVFQDR